MTQFYSDEQIDHLFNSITPKLAALVEFRFKTHTKRMWNGTTHITAGGEEWLALAGLGNIEGHEEPRSPQAVPVTFTLGLVTEEMLALAFDSNDEVQGRLAIVYDLILDDDYRPVGSPIPRIWAIMSRLSIERQPATDVAGGMVRTIKVHAENSFFAVGKASNRQYTDRDQQNLYPGDRALEHISNTKLTRNVWPDF